MVKSIIIIDGGGTKIKALKFEVKNSSLKLVKEIQIEEFANPLVDYESSKNSLIKVINILGTTNETSIVIGLAGWQSFIEKQKFTNDVKFNVKQKKLKIISDVEILQKAFHDKNKDILIGIAGTGTAFILDTKNHGETLNGWGHLIFEPGSGYELSKQLIIEALEEKDYNKEHCILNYLLDYYKVKNVEEVINNIYTSTEKKYFANFLGYIGSKIEKDKKLEKIIDSIFEKVSTEFVDVIKKIHLVKGVNIDIIIFNGSVLQYNKNYQKKVYDKIYNLLPNVKIMLTDLNNVNDLTISSMNPLVRMAISEIKKEGNNNG